MSVNHADFSRLSPHWVYFCSPLAPCLLPQPTSWCQHWEAHNHLPLPWTSVSTSISYSVFYLCGSKDSWIFVKSPLGIQWARCTAQKQGSESRCKALNWAKYPGVLSIEWNREERRASWIPHLGSPPGTTYRQWMKGEKNECAMQKLLHCLTMRSVD